MKVPKEKRFQKDGVPLPNTAVDKIVGEESAKAKPHCPARLFWQCSIFYHVVCVTSSPLFLRNKAPVVSRSQTSVMVL
jgi:hypothetical protein